jgi:hypothetical protein
MNVNKFSIRAVAAIGALCGAVAIPAISHAAGAVSVNGTTHCASSATMSLTPAGDIAITCGASGPPACSVSPGTSNIGVNQQVTLTATCNPAASTYSWTVTGGGPNIAGAGGTPLTFTQPGTFTYSVTGTNGSGAGAASAAATVTVTAASVAPTCTVIATPSTITAGGTSTLTASCSPIADTYTWGGNGPVVSGAGGTVTFANAGSYTYTVRGTNSVGQGPVSATIFVTVNAAGSGCSTVTAGAFTGNGIKHIGIERGGNSAFSLPVYTQSNRLLEILSIQSMSSSGDLTAEYAISPCAGDFSVPAACRTWGTVNSSGMQLYASTGTAQVSGNCTLINGTQYYLNVRMVLQDRVTPACTVQTCYMNVQLNSFQL